MTKKLRASKPAAPEAGTEPPAEKAVKDFPCTILEDSFDGILIVQKGVVSYCNRTFAEMFGYDKSIDVIGKEISKLIYLRDYKPGDPVENCLQGAHELLAWRKNGVEFEVQTRCTQTVFHDEPAAQVVVHDISKLRELEKQLHQAQKMEVIGTLSSGIAHDFNNILSIIMGYIELSIDRRVNDSNVITQNLVQAMKAAHRAKDLVQQILMFTRRGEKQRAPVKITPLVKEAVKLIRSSLPSTITIQQEISPKNYVILGNPTQVHQVLMNLCTNAGQAMKKDGGTLTVVLSDLNRDLQSIVRESLAPSPYLRLTVSDTGPGIPPEIKERIFEPFFTTKEEGEGTGMGLAVVMGIVKNLDGEISVESEPGKGSSFHVFLPILHENGELDIDPERSIPGGKERILLAEDEIVLLNIVKRMLERLGYKVVAMCDGVDALETFRADPNQFDLVISDLTMPGITGIQLARQLLKIRPNIPVIICTGFNEGINRDNLRDLGMKGFIMKPYTLEKIGNAIREALS